MAYVKGQFDVTQNVDANGDPATSYILKFFIWDTATPATVYSDSSGTSLGTTVTLNSLGQPQTSGGTACDIFFDTAVVYKAQLYLSDGATTVGTSIGPFYPLGLNSSQTVDSFAAAYGSTFTGIDAVTTRSFYGSWSGTTAGPKGGATYHRDGTTGTASTAYADNSGFYDANGDGFRLAYAGSVSVFQFGAVYSTAAAQSDTSTAIQNANDFVGANGGGVVYFPRIGSSNYYHISTGLTNAYANVTWAGDSPTANMIRAMDGSNIDMYTCTPSGAGLDNVSMRNLHFNGNKSNNTSGRGIVIANIHAISHFEHVIASQCKTTGWDVSDCTVVQLNNCYGTSCDGIGYDLDSIVSLFMTDCVSEFHGTSYIRIRNTQDLSVIPYTIKGLHVEGATTEPSAGYAIGLFGGATNAIVVSIDGTGFRATSIAANPIYINDAQCNVKIQLASKSSWGAFIDNNADSSYSVSGVSTISEYTYCPSTAVSQCDNYTVIDDLTTSGLVLSDSGELTIASGAITITGSRHTVDTEADAASDDVSTINGGTDGQILIISAADSSRTVAVQDGTGNIQLNGNFSMDNTQDRLMLIKDGSVWVELSRSDNTA